MARCEVKESVDKAVAKLREDTDHDDYERLKANLLAVYRSHLARVRGESDPEDVLALVDQITGGA